MYIDTHAHLYLEDFAADINEVVQECIQEHVSHIYLPNVDTTTIKPMLDLVARFPEMMHPMMGLHPCSVNQDYRQALDLEEEYLSQYAFAAIGEIGIDLYWDKTYFREQQDAFEIQIGWAKSMGIPFVIHSRESLDLTIATVKKLQDGNLSGIFHCFNGTVDQGKAIVDLGFHLGIGGVITYKNAGMKVVIKQLPLSAMVLETDAPYLSPVPFRGKRNQSNYIPIIAQHLAEALETDIREIESATTANALEIFGTPK